MPAYIDFMPVEDVPVSNAGGSMEIRISTLPQKVTLILLDFTIEFKTEKIFKHIVNTLRRMDGKLYC
ncbi:hypothetical protein [Ferroplasma sp.]|uniref:hypothetical protein n=1 Tax=Ferroplasma sp. TaxID=2591003 RepID=UPI002619D4A8|nr:hypothetical protein [Ferroplasma sp.]MCL4453934.1 hypothetical protein [Candidatus Thermoplasmatota archaeon]